MKPWEHNVFRVNASYEPLLVVEVREDADPELVASVLNADGWPKRFIVLMRDLLCHIHTQKERMLFAAGVLAATRQLR